MRAYSDLIAAAQEGNLGQMMVPLNTKQWRYHAETKHINDRSRLAVHDKAVFYADNFLTGSCRLLTAYPDYMGVIVTNRAIAQIKKIAQLINDGHITQKLRVYTDTTYNFTNELYLTIMSIGHPLIRSTKNGNDAIMPMAAVIHGKR